MLKCSETLILYLFCPEVQKFSVLHQNHPKFQIMIHKNSSPHDLYTLTLSPSLVSLCSEMLSSACLAATLKAQVNF
jgi:hypothetical protein